MPKLRHHWSSDPKIDGLIFFAQTMDEMLFHFTIDSYKAPISNVHYLLFELQTALKNAENLKLGKDATVKNIKPICDELVDRISNDFVAKEFIEKKYGKNGYKTIMRNLIHWTNYDKYYLFVDSLRIFFKNEYYAKIIENLYNSIKVNEYEKIVTLCRAFIPELLLKGFSSEYVYYSTDSYFFNERDFSDISRIDNYIKSYLDLFEGENKKWDIIVRVSDDFHYIKNHLDEINSKLKDQEIKFHSTSINPRTDDQFEKLFLTGEYKGLSKNCPNYITIKANSALDPYKAKDTIFWILNYLNNFLAFSTYYIQLKWDDIVLVYSSENVPIITKKPVSPLAKNKKFEKFYTLLNSERYQDLSKLCKKQQDMIEINLDKSGYQLFKSLSIHSSSINSKNIENQYLNAWICLENLLPKYLGKTILDKFKNGYLPFLNRKYFHKIIENFHDDLLFHTHGKIEGFFSDFPQEYKSLSSFEKCVVLISVNDKSENVIEKAKKKMGRNPLLIYRLEELYKKIESPKAIKKSLQDHNQRLDWHLTRLYRARNLLTHLGEKNYHLDKLLENLNYYYHMIIDQIEEISKNNTHIKSLEAIFEWTQIEYSSYLSTLHDNKNSEISYDNFRQLVLSDK